MKSGQLKKKDFMEYYMAPEVLCGHSYTKVADIYSFGIIIN
jgi:hypothetical protein